MNAQFKSIPAASSCSNDSSRSGVSWPSGMGNSASGFPTGNSPGGQKEHPQSSHDWAVVVVGAARRRETTMIVVQQCIDNRWCMVFFVWVRFAGTMSILVCTAIVESVFYCLLAAKGGFWLGQKQSCKNCQVNHDDDQQYHQQQCVLARSIL